MLDVPTAFCALREHTVVARARMPHCLGLVEQASAYVTPMGLKAWYRALFPNAGPTGRGEAVVSAPLVALKACSKWLVHSCHVCRGLAPRLCGVGCLVCYTSHTL